MNEQEHSDLESFNKLLDIGINFTVILGSIFLTIEEILKLEVGVMINLKKPAGEGLDITIGHRPIGRGDIIVYDKNLAVRINEVLDSDEIIQSLAREG